MKTVSLCLWALLSGEAAFARVQEIDCDVKNDFFGGYGVGGDHDEQCWFFYRSKDKPSSGLPDEACHKVEKVASRVKCQEMCADAKKACDKPKDGVGLDSNLVPNYYQRARAFAPEESTLAPPAQTSTAVESDGEITH